MPLRDIYERTFDEGMLLARTDEEYAVEEEQSDDREIHNTGKNADPTEMME